jgi:3-dehydroquinate dehydratase II
MSVANVKINYICGFMNIIIINGPNLNLLGQREPEIYGNESFDSYFLTLKNAFPRIELSVYQSNVEGELINKLHETGFTYSGIVLNAGGYTHTSIALADAVASITSPVIEVHISNIFSREEYRHVSLLSKYCKGIISGFGLKGYHLAIQALLSA